MIILGNMKLSNEKVNGRGAVNREVKWKSVSFIFISNTESEASLSIIIATHLLWLTFLTLPLFSYRLSFCLFFLQKHTFIQTKTHRHKTKGEKWSLILKTLWQAWKNTYLIQSQIFLSLNLITCLQEISYTAWKPLTSTFPFVKKPFLAFYRW